MRKLIPVASLLVLAIFQLGLTVPQLFPVVPNLLLIFVCISFLFLRLTESFVLAIVAGIILDIFSGFPDGVMLLALSTAVVTAYYLGQIIFTEKYSSFIVIFYVLSSTIFFTLAVLLFSWVLSWINLAPVLPVNNYLWQRTGMEVTFNLIFLYPVYWVYYLQTKIEKALKLKNESI